MVRQVSLRHTQMSVFLASYASFFFFIVIVLLSLHALIFSIWYHTCNFFNLRYTLPTRGSFLRCTYVSHYSQLCSLHCIAPIIFIASHLHNLLFESDTLLAPNLLNLRHTDRQGGEYDPWGKFTEWNRE